MLIEKRLEGMANRQEEFLEKLETTIREKWREEAIHYLLSTVAERVAKNYPPDLVEMSYKTMMKELNSLRRIDGSIYIKIQIRQSRIRVEKSGDDLVVFSDGFKPTKLGIFLIYIGLPVMWIGFGCLFSLIPLIMYLAPKPLRNPIAEQNVKIILLILLYYGIISFLAYALRKVLIGREGLPGRKARDVLNHFLKGSIEETINLFK